MKKALLPYVLALVGTSLLAQTAVQQFKAEVPDAFGSVPGRVVLAGDQLVFSSDTKPEASFGAARRDIQGVSSEGDVVTIQLRTPIRDASGERNRLTVRVTDQTARNAISTWFSSFGTTSSTAAQPAASPPKDLSANEPRIYQAHHKKAFGGSKGRLLVTDDGLAYESIDDVKDSRRWEFRDIKEVKLKSPYEIEVQPFSGGEYDIAIEGQGMAAFFRFAQYAFILSPCAFR
jgi:hypothetical protein